MRLRIISGIALIVLLAIVAVSCFSNGAGTYDEPKGKAITEPKTGISARGEVEGGSLVITPGQAPGFSQENLMIPVGEPAKVEAKGGQLNGKATLTFPYPDTYDAHVSSLFVARYNDTVRQWVPQGGIIDTKKRTVTVYTTEFSYWTLARFDEENSQKQLKYMLEDNFYSSTLYAGYSGLFSSPPPRPTGCTTNLQYGRRTIQADVSGLMKRMRTDVCVGRTPKGKYILSIGNTAGYPVLFQLPQAVKVLQVVPDRKNVFGVFVEQLRIKFGDSAVVLRGGQRVVLEIEPDKLASDGVTITAKMDMAHVFLDLSSVMLQILVPLSPKETAAKTSDQRIALSAKQAEKFATMVNCYTAAGHRAQAEFAKFESGNRVLPLLKMHEEIMKGLSSCTSQQLAFFIELLSDPVAWLGDQAGKLVVEKVKNLLPELLKSRLDQALIVWRDAGVFRQLFSSIFALISDRGLSTYSLRVTIVRGDEQISGSGCADDPTHGGVLSPGRLFPRPCRTPLPSGSHTP